MGRSARIDVEVGGGLAVLDSLEALLRAGWGFEPMHVVAHLPLGDNGMFAWQDAPLEEWPALRRAFEEKASRGELVGVQLLWKDSLVGASFLFYPDGSVSAGLLGNRPRIEATDGVADMSWFLARLLPAWLEAGASIVSVECHDSEG